MSRGRTRPSGLLVVAAIAVCVSLVGCSLLDGSDGGVDGDHDVVLADVDLADLSRDEFPGVLAVMLEDDLGVEMVYDADREAIRESDGAWQWRIDDVWSDYVTLPTHDREPFIEEKVASAAGIYRSGVVESELYPVVMDEEWATLTEQDIGENWQIARVPLAGAYRIAIVLRVGDSWATPSLTNLAEAGYSPEDAVEIALANLSREPGDGSFVEVEPGVYQAEWDDEISSSRMLAPGLVAELDVQGDPVALPIGADNLYVTGSDDPEGLVAVGEAAYKSFIWESRTIGCEPLVYRDGAWHLFTVPSELDDWYEILAYDWLARLAEAYEQSLDE